MQDTPFAALCADAHNLAAYHAERLYGFARRTVLVAVGFDELAAVLRHYPVLFVRDATTFPVALLALEGQGNAFVDADGAWAANHYVPAAIALHPFMLEPMPDRETGILLFDTTSRAITLTARPDDPGRLFRDDRTPTDLLRSIAAKHARFHDAKAKAAEFGALLSEAGLLHETGIELNEQGRPGVKLFAIHEPAYRLLPAGQVERWFRDGWLDAAALLLSAQAAWTSILRTRAQGQPLTRAKPGQGD
jgi:hypothetical protein